MLLSFLSDEETDGHLGMELFVKTNEFKSMNVGLVLDEGLANLTETYSVFYGERNIWGKKLVQFYRF